MSVVLMGVVDGGRRLETHSVVRIFRIIFGIQVESTCLAFFSLLNIDVTDSLIMEQVVCRKLLLICNQLFLTPLEVGSLQVVI